MEAQNAATVRNLPPGFLGKICQICIVTPDYRKTVGAMLRSASAPGRFIHSARVPVRI